MRRARFIVFFVIISWLASCSNDSGTGGLNNNGSQPNVTGVTPNTVNPGSREIEGRVLGSNFVNVMAVSLGESIHVHQFATLNANEIYVFFSVSEDASPGPRDVVVATIAGTATAQVMTVGDNRVPEAKFKVTPAAGEKDTLFHFDASQSEDDGRIIDYKWKFGDGKQATGRVVTHRFGRGGEFEVNLTVRDDKNAEVSSIRTMEVSASQKPVPAFTVTPDSGSLDTVFQFDASSSHDPDGRITDYIWYLDGTIKHGKTVSHQFTRLGSLSVALTVIDNTRESQILGRLVGVGTGGGGNPPPPPGGGQCTSPAKNRGLIFGTIVGVEGFDAIVQFDPGSNCANTYYHCGDMRKANPENFYGIIRAMTDLGNGKFRITNDCPFRWPPPVGETVFLIYKTCAVNFCP